MSENRSFDSLIPTISFFRTQVHTVEFDPSVEWVEINGTGQDGREYSRRAIPVVEDGTKVLLSLSKDLEMKLHKVGKKARIQITRNGSGFDTTYDVKVVGK